jgi:hypothetical protein
MSIFGNIKTTTMMNDLLLELGNPTIKTIDISLQIVGGIRSGCIVTRDLIVSPLLC